jgi:diaminohydroxyphosphoribosylaminopyrimidine deaminase/5-amino-6-(5-phosphoribosylamino)uracil reductase
MREHELYMRRCLELAVKGSGYVAPNPMVGAVIVHAHRIIGEGYHEIYGGPHAEVNAINNVAEADKELLASATIYVSLEPCSHFGKTPPCVDLIIQNNIPRVVIGCRDPFAAVNGTGIRKLRDAGVEVIENILEADCLKVNRRFICFHKNQRPYIILKWAESADGFIGRKDKRARISGDLTDRLVHKLRGGEAAIMVGTQTALTDDPRLTVRYWEGKNPVRIVVDSKLKIPASAKLLNGEAPTIVINHLKQEEQGNLSYYKTAEDADLLAVVLNLLHQRSLNSLIVEGGANLITQFLKRNLYDEIVRIVSPEMYLGEGIPAPALGFRYDHAQKSGSDDVYYYMQTGSWI